MTAVKSNQKKIYSLIFGNYTEGVQAMFKGDKDYEEKSKVKECGWILIKVKTITSGLDMKVNLRVLLHAALLNFMLLRQFNDEANDAYLTRFKSMIKTLKIAGGEYGLVSPTLMGKTINTVRSDEVNDGKEMEPKGIWLFVTITSDQKRIHGPTYDWKDSLPQDCVPIVTNFDDNGEPVIELVKLSDKFDHVGNPMLNVKHYLQYQHYVISQRWLKRKTMKPILTSM